METMKKKEGHGGGKEMTRSPHSNSSTIVFPAILPTITIFGRPGELPRCFLSE